MLPVEADAGVARRTADTTAKVRNDTNIHAFGYDLVRLRVANAGAIEPQIQFPSKTGQAQRRGH
jgi:hypothetical protein